MRQPICALVTTTARDRTIPTYVEVDPTESGLDEMSFVLCHPLVTKDERDMDAQPVGDLGYPKIHEVELALARALDLTGANEPRTGVEMRRGRPPDRPRLRTPASWRSFAAFALCV